MNEVLGMHDKFSAALASVWSHQIPLELDKTSDISGFASEAK